tara:strand:- start:208 stop:315 length:108 start_codon:yes stop_codon:yes gene_type:complete
MVLAVLLGEPMAAARGDRAEAMDVDWRRGRLPKVG